MWKNTQTESMIKVLQASRSERGLSGRGEDARGPVTVRRSLGRDFCAD